MKKRVFYLKNLQSYDNRKFTSNVLQKLKSSYNVSLLLLKIEHSFFQESIDNNKSIGVTIYRCQIQAIIKKRKTFEVFKLIYFKKLPIKKVLMKLRVISDASVLLKCWFYKQAPQKVLIELSPGVLQLTIVCSLPRSKRAIAMRFLLCGIEEIEKKQQLLRF